MRHTWASVVKSTIILIFHLTEGSKSKYYVLHREVNSGDVYVVNSQYHPGLYSSEAFLDMGN